jgi:predicted secreted acid phosphatase
MALWSPARKVDPSVLDETLARARAGAPSSVVVFDLDSTLLDNRPRQAVILREFGELHGIQKLLEAKPEHWDGWSLRRAMANVGLAPSEIERWADEAKGFWRDRFFTSHYCALDDAIPGAVDYVKAVLDTGAQVVYCTGRHEAMREGTIRSFHRLGFPDPGTSVRVQLLMKPTFDESDDDFKATAYARLRELGRIVAAFDNEPTHINGYRVAFPDALAVHLDTDHSEREVALLDSIPSIPHFAR